MFLSFACGVGWAGLFLLVKDALPGVPFELMMGVGVALVIFLILSVHPILLGRTPFGVVPAVLLGLIESLLVTMVTPMLVDGAPGLNLLRLLVVFGYGCLMTLILVAVQDRLISAVLGTTWRSAPTEDTSTRAPRVVGRAGTTVWLWTTVDSRDSSRAPGRWPNRARAASSASRDRRARERARWPRRC
ncbi:hypothetical protein [Rhodococcus koreensis]|uniref:hypothetical protein n=1 Tax=Rhodococcus koreensis TaxID=99653 RepID=UPI00366E4ADA